MRMPPRRVVLLPLTETAQLPCYGAGEIGTTGRANVALIRPDRNDPMLARVKTLLGWIVAPLCVLVIVPAVFFFERSLRLEKRRDPAWRSR
jgi:hypothetical protein